MLEKVKIIICLMCSTYSALSFADANTALLTLFTTPQERQLIDANRYKNNAENVVEVKEKPSEVIKSEEVVQKERIEMELLLSGFTLTGTGQNVAWINTRPYEHGSSLEDGSTVLINAFNEKSVYIKTPDGHRHKIVTGKPQKVEYFKAVKTEG